MGDLFELGRRVLALQPFSVLVGTQLGAFAEGFVELVLEIRPELKQQHGYVHGGVISYLADNALTFAGGSVLGDVVTAEYKINYLRPATGEKLIARATVVGQGLTQAVCRCEIFVVKNGAEKLCAAAQGTIVKIQGPTT
jgi:uncharacterized protein (TIGR00369 family)